jgi:hypothetical protein
MSLTFTTTNDTLIVTGKTFYAKDELKKFGGKYSTGSWTLPLNADSPANRAIINSAVAKGIETEKAAAKARRDYAKTPAGIAYELAAQLKSAKSRGWTCCDKAYVMDITKGHTGCNEHGFFVKGILRTGD